MKKSFNFIQITFFLILTHFTYANNGCPAWFPMPSDDLVVVIPIYDMRITEPDLDCDGIIDRIDNDIDGDGVINIQDAFPRDARESIDTDGDGIGNNADTDDDNDGYSDSVEIIAGSDPLDPNDIPANIHVNDWLRTNPGAGGAFSMIGATASGLLVAGSDLSGVYISENNGTTWKALGENSGLLDTSVQALGFDPSDGNVFYAGTTSGIYRTQDGGVSFLSITPDTIFPKSHGMLIESIETSQNKIYITYHTWNVKNDASKVAVGTISNNNISWTVLPSFGITPLQIIKLVVDPLDPTIVYALSGNSRYACSPAKAYRLQYTGATPSSWAEISTDIISRELTRNAVDVNSTIGILDIVVDSSQAEGVYLSTFNPRKCPTELNANATELQVAMWNYVYDSEIGNIYHYNGVSAQALSDNEGRTGIIVNDQGVIRVMNILNFEELWGNHNIIGTWEYKNNIWTRFDDITQWKIGPSNNPSYAFGFSYYGLNKTLTKDKFNPNHIYGTYGFNGVSFDGGKTFKRLSTTKKVNDTWRSTGLDNIVGTVIDVSDSNKNIVYMGGTDIGVWVSKNHGESWTMRIPSEAIYQKYIWGQAFDNSIYAYPGGSNVDTLISDPQRESKVWSTFSASQSYGVAGEDDNGVRTEFTGLFKSDEYGENWRLITGGDMPEDGRMYGLSLDKQTAVNHRTLYMTVNGHVFKSTDDGEHWIQKTPNGNNGICGLNVMSVKAGTENGCGLKITAIDAKNSNLVYAGGESGLWRSTDGGEQWSKIGGAQMEANRTRAFNMNRDISPTYNAHKDDETLPYAWEGIFDIKTDPNIGERVYVTMFGAGYEDKGGFYRSDDAGVHWTKINLPALNGVDPDRYLRGIAIDPNNSNNIFVSSSQAYHSGGDANTSVGILYSTDAGATWKFANSTMAWNYGGMMEVENTTQNPCVWAWSPGTGLQYAELHP